MVGILQMFTLSLLTNFGSAARTDLLYKAQQVVENLRLVYYLEVRLANDTARVASGVPAAISATTAPIYLPYDASGADPMTPGADDPNTALTWAYWGPEGLQRRRGGEAPLPAFVHRRRQPRTRTSGSSR